MFPQIVFFSNFLVSTKVHLAMRIFVYCLTHYQIFRSRMGVDFLWIIQQGAFCNQQILLSWRCCCLLFFSNLVGSELFFFDCTSSLCLGWDKFCTKVHLPINQLKILLSSHCISPGIDHQGLFKQGLQNLPWRDVVLWILQQLLLFWFVQATKSSRSQPLNVRNESLGKAHLVSSSVHTGLYQGLFNESA